MDKEEIEKYKKAGEISKQIKEFTRKIIKKDMLLVDIAKKIEDKIIELGGMPAFPVNLSIDDIAAHYHPTLGDTTTAQGLLKIDMGIHIDGFIADSAISIDLTDNKEHKKLIEATENALKFALELQEKNPTLNDTGKIIQEKIEEDGFSAITNLSGHSLERYEIHAGITIPNCANNSQKKLQEGAYAIEPFATTGKGSIYEGPAGNIYAIENLKNTRNPTARKILDYIWGKNKQLPFSAREIEEKFGKMSRLALRELVQQGILHSFNQLIEISHKPIAQAEHTFLKTKEGKIIVTTM